MPSAMPSPTVRPLSSQGDGSSLGAIIADMDIENLSDADFNVIQDALYHHQVVVFKKQGHLSPKAQYEVTQRFDPAAAGAYGHSKTLDAKRSILHPDLKTIPHQPQVQVIGNGFVESYEGLENITLRHPHHRTFHATRIPDEDDLDFTRYYRWHIDAALYGLAPPVATSLLAVRVPGGRSQTLRYDDGTGDEKTVPLGTTAFVSGAAMYEALSSEDQAFCRSTKVEYAPHPYVWMSGARSRSDGLGLVSEGRELPLSDLPPVDADRSRSCPCSGVTPSPALCRCRSTPPPCRNRAPHRRTVLDDLAEVREIVHRLQRARHCARKGGTPHDWEEGDFVIFHNRGVLHSVVGAFAEHEVRLFRQCNIAGSALPVGPEGV
ncbi:alpha-ketoglutarate dependent xanthine dioxygenase [Verticillium alfalfae VaMs.102]|uniref:Alpha-ketoglutarate dependent xanthine dioxygenase n=1 Tax=Verticillium alfalfae (strain VaMs.102 / ATCC MYA-4576 / FGSC 10136) TaxID=526221 RepID=C9SHT2_VERA1|nr:alpha-ketoglutarate dependent xanthine dioxygenase [Verticillium alfalfae VaMs.102]EEY18505.1 alpha-ketoglutarate dependent xanthine dioxygenase [Verticillium alfalfae VaMs.102]